MKRVLIIVFGDFLSFGVSFLLVLFLRYGTSLFSIELGKHLLPFIILYFSWTFVFFLFGLYDLFAIKPTIPHLRRFFLAIIFSLILGIMFFYFMPIFGISPKTNLFFQIIGFGLLSFLVRRMIYIIYSSRITRPAILVGNSKYLKELNFITVNNPQIGLKIISNTNSLNEALKKYSNIKLTLLIN